MMLVTSPVQCLAQKWDCLMVGPTLGSPQCPAFSAPVLSGPPNAAPAPSASTLRPSTAPGPREGAGSSGWWINHPELAMSRPPAVDAGVEKRKDEPTVACRGGFAGRQLPH